MELLPFALWGVLQGRTSFDFAVGAGAKVLCRRGVERSPRLAATLPLASSPRPASRGPSPSHGRLHLSYNRRKVADLGAFSPQTVSQCISLHRR